MDMAAETGLGSFEFMGDRDKPGHDGQMEQI